MQRYARDGRFRHPTTPDFLQAFGAGSGFDVKPLATALLESTGVLDYAVESIERMDEPDLAGLVGDELPDVDAPLDTRLAEAIRAADEVLDLLRAVDRVEMALFLRETREGLWLGGLGLFSIGVLNGSLTSGTGLFVTLWLVRWFGADYRQAVAYTLVLVGVFWNGSGAIALGILGEVQWSWLPALLAGSLLGGFAGSRILEVHGQRMIDGRFEPGARITTQYKDMRQAVERRVQP